MTIGGTSSPYPKMQPLTSCSTFREAINENEPVNKKAERAFDACVANSLGGYLEHLTHLA